MLFRTLTPIEKARAMTGRADVSSAESWLAIEALLQKGQLVLLKPGCSQQELAQAEELYGRPIPSAVVALLQNWNERGAEFLLEAMPRLLNPGATKQDLEPAGAGMSELFPEFCELLATTQEFSVMLKPYLAHKHESIILTGRGSKIAAANDYMAAEVAKWAIHLPPTLEEIAQHEANEGLKLPAQLKQLLLRANGSIEAEICPYFYSLDILYPFELVQLYEDSWESVTTAETFERMKKFVTFMTDTNGDYWRGYFIDQFDGSAEPPVYEWATARFECVASDFAESLSQILTHWFVMPSSQESIQG